MAAGAGEALVVDVEGTQVAATVHRPGAAAATGGAVVLGHGLGATADMGLGRYASAFAAVGLVAVTFDYRSFGASGGEPRRILDVGRQLDDWAAVVAATRRLAGVDADRVALWGTSFSGGHVFEVARRDGRIAAVSSQCPFTDGRAAFTDAARPPAASGDDTGLLARSWALARISALAVADQASALARRPPVRVAVFGPPGSTALLSAPDCAAGYSALVPPGSTFANDVAARIALQVPTYRPGRAAADLACPILAHVCDRDSVAPPAVAARVIGANPRAEVVHLDCGHFDLYQDPWVGPVLERQATFLAAATAP